MTRRLVGLALVLGLSVSAFAAGISGPDTVGPYQLVRLEATEPAESSSWVIFPFGKADGVTVDGGKGYAFIGPPGEYNVLLSVIRDGKIDQATKTVFITGPAPAPAPVPPPGPGPAPEPPPTPVPDGYTGRLWGVLILPDVLTPDLAVLRTSPTLRAELSVRDATLRSYLASEAEVQADGWKRALARYGEPPILLWITGETPPRILKATRPATERAIVDDLRAIRGVR